MYVDGNYEFQRGLVVLVEWFEGGREGGTGGLLWDCGIVGLWDCGIGRVEFELYCGILAGLTTGGGSGSGSGSGGGALAAGLRRIGSTSGR